MADLRHLKVFVVAPPDVEDERRRLVTCVDEVNQHLRDEGVAFDLWHWRQGLVPGLHPEGPAGLVAQEVADAHLVVAVLWNQVGEALDDPSASLEPAVRRWRQEGRPDVLAYLCQRPPSRRPTKAERREAERVDDVVEALERGFSEGDERIALFQPFTEAEDFEQAVRRALMAHGRRALGGQLETASAPQAQPGNLAVYLERVRSQCGSIELAGLVRADQGAATLPLEKVYVSLSATRRDSLQRADPGLEGRPDAEGAVRRVIAALKDDEQRPSLPERIEAALRALGMIGPSDGVPAVAAAKERLLALEDETETHHVRRVLETEPVEALLRRSEHLLIEGNPGTGKTTTLKHVAIALVRARLGDTKDAESMGFGGSGDFPLPLFASLAEFAPVIRDRPAPVADDLLSFLAERHGAWARPAAERGRAVVLLDGLDEVVEERLMKTTADALRDFVQTCPGCRLVVTSRPAGMTSAVRYKLLELGKLGHAQVEHLGPGERRRFVRAWYRALVTEDPEERAADLLARIRANERLAQLVDTPILLTAVSVVHLNGGRLPERRAELYEQCVLALSGRIDALRGVHTLLDHDRRLFVLSKLAFERHRRGEAGRNLERAELIRVVAEQLALQRRGRHEPEPGSSEEEQASQQLVDRTGLLVHAGEAQFAFRHLTFQEFLAARWLDKNAEQPVALLAPHLHEPWWREVVQLHLGFRAKDGPTDAVERLRALIDRAEGAHRAAALGTLARALIDLRSYPQNEAFEPEAARLAPQLVELIEDRSQPGSLEDRVAMGDVLGLYGDPRLSEDRRWLPIPSGRFFRGARDDDDDAYDWEKPAGWVSLTQPYRIQRWPVTVAEYRDFAREGYATEAWWSTEGWAWRRRAAITEPQHWERQQQQGPSAPVVGVSWWEAEAYGLWCSAVRWPELTVRLPTEAEWERAARGGEHDEQPRRRYPWGDAWSSERAVSLQSGVGRAVAVGLHPKGHGPKDIWDMSGNVWEWCLDAMGEWDPYPEAETIDPLGQSDSSGRAFRGGSWHNDPQGLRVPCRSWDVPRNRFGFLGFRVVAAPGRSNPGP